MKRADYTVFKFIIIATLILFTEGCGKIGAGGGASKVCGANVVDDGLSLSVTPLGSNTYRFELCSPSNPPNAQYSVYGAANETALSPVNINLNASWRRRQISDAYNTGAFFQVTFHSDDRAFVIYLDRNSGGGVYVMDATQPLVHPHQLP